MRISDWSSDVCSSDLHTPPPLEAECDELHETIRILLATLGYPVFQPLARSEVVEQPDEVFHCRASEADARGLYTEEGFVVLAGSSGRLDTVPSFQSHGYHRVRERSEEHTSELQSLMRISYAVFCLKKKKISTSTKPIKD